MRKEVGGPGGRHRTKEHRAAAPQPEGRGAPPSEELQGSGLFVVKPALRRRKGAAEFPWKMLRLLERLLTQKQRLRIAREEVLEENSSGRTGPRCGKGTDDRAWHLGWSAPENREFEAWRG